jgi:predicted ATPase
MDKAVASYGEFKNKFVRTMQIQPSIDTATEAYNACTWIAKEVRDPEAQAFVAKFSELLQQFISEGKTFLAMDEQYKERYQAFLKWQTEGTKNVTPGGKALQYGESNEATSRQDVLESERRSVGVQADKVQKIRAQLVQLKST